MADTNIKPEVSIAKTDYETLTNISRNREAVRNNVARRLHKEHAIPQVEEKANIFLKPYGV